MTDYERGFNAGENEAWKGRGSLLPKIPTGQPLDECAQGYWDARLPRNPLWVRQRPIVPAKWDEKSGKYTIGKVIA